MERIAVIMGKMHSGGKKNLVMEYYRHIDRDKIQFDFICDKDSNAIPKEEIEKSGGRVYEVEPYQKIIRNMKDIRRICKQNQYRIMHCYNGTMNLFSLFIGWWTGVPVRISESISMAHSADKKTIIKNALKPFSKMFATHYLANGETCGRWQFGNKLYDQGKIHIFKTVIDVEHNVYDIRVRQKVRESMGIKDDFVVGHIGRLTEQKNTLFMIDIFAEILKKEKKSRLLIIGDGNLREEMLNKIERMGISDKVIYLGRREDIVPFYNAMDCFLLPSFYEGLPVVGIEAQTSGLPIFFSSEIPRETCVCAELCYFIDINKSAREWAEIIIKSRQDNTAQRAGRGDEVRAAGFDSAIEAEKLSEFYLQTLSDID